MSTFFVSGHLDLTEQEFADHYVAEIDKAIADKGWFVVGDAKGCDTLAQQYLWKHAKPFEEHKVVDLRVIVFHMLDKPRFNAGFQTIGGFKSDEDRDLAMTLQSTHDIAWVRPGRENSGTAKNLQRRALIAQDKGPQVQLEILNESGRIDKIIDAPLYRIDSGMAFLFKTEAVYCLSEGECGRYFCCDPDSCYRLSEESHKRCRELMGRRSW